MITSIVNGLLLIWLVLEVIAIMRHRLPSTPSQDKGSFQAIWITVAAAFLLSDTVPKNSPEKREPGHDYSSPGLVGGSGAGHSLRTPGSA